MPFWNCYYHIVWTTKYRQPTITLQMERLIFSAVEQKSAELHCPILALNAVADHVHVAVCITPSVAVANWVGQSKGLSAHAINANFNELEISFKWQDGYGAVTFGEKQLPFVQAYIQQQKQHHESGKVFEKLERSEE